MSILVTNRRNSSIKVSINEWASGGDTTYFTIDSNDYEEWGRTDSRGFVMYITDSGGVDGAYYVRGGSSIDVNQDGSVYNAVKV